MTESTPRSTSGDAGESADSAADGRNGREPTADSTEEAVARGRATETPFVLLGGVATVIWLVVALVAAALLLIWWLG